MPASSCSKLDVLFILCNLCIDILIVSLFGVHSMDYSFLSPNWSHPQLIGRDDLFRSRLWMDTGIVGRVTGARPGASMAETLDIHPASPEERLQCYENVYEFWPMASSLEEHLRLRCGFSQTPTLLTGTPGASAEGWWLRWADFPLKFHIDGREVAGFSNRIGSHPTRISAERGFGAAVMDWAERDRMKQGRSTQFPLLRHRSGLLRQTGLPALPFLERPGENRSRFPLGTGERHWDLQQFSASQALSELQEIYRAHHGAYPLAHGALARLLEDTSLLKQPFEMNSTG